MICLYTNKRCNIQTLYYKKICAALFNLIPMNYRHIFNCSLGNILVTEVRLTLTAKCIAVIGNKLEGHIFEDLFLFS